MNVKTLTTSLATATLVGIVGLAYAQTTTDPAAPATGSTMQRSTTDPTLPATPSTAPRDSGTRSSTPGDGTMNAPAPRVDRG